MPVLVPVYRESRATIERFLRAASSLDTLSFDVVLVAGQDEPEDLRVLRSLERQEWRFKTMVITSCKPKARALNDAVRAVNADRVILLDVDCLPNGETFAAMVEALDAGADVVEPLTLSPGTGFWQRAANSRVLAFFASNEWLRLATGQNFLGTQACILRSEVFTALGDLPEDGVEETFRWSFRDGARTLRHVLIPEALETPAPATPWKMIEQHRRWSAGQFVGLWEARGAKGGLRSLRRFALWSLSAQALVPLIACGLVFPRRRRTAVLLLAALVAFESGRFHASARGAAGQMHRSKLNTAGGVLLELFEGISVLLGASALLGFGRERWASVR